jgi:Potential Queuosine, Q, salvage protein family
MRRGLLDEVRENAASVVASARYVHIQDANVAEYAAAGTRARPAAPELDPATHILGQGETSLAFMITLDAINFGSGFFPRLRKRPGMSGYFTVAASLKDEFETRGEPWSAAELRRLTRADMARVIKQDLADEAIAELMDLFARALNDLGTFVEQRGGFRAVVEAADHSAERLATSLTSMPFYDDTGFYKRAQLTAADLALLGERFDDLQRLTIFADNLVPHVLRMDGLLAYEPALLERIEREELIPSGSVEEREIRASAVHVVELLARASGMSPMAWDYVLWNRGQEPAYKARPRHRTRSVYY